MKAIPASNAVLKKDIKRLFSFLFKDHGFNFVAVKNDFNGNVVIAQSDNLRFRFIHDRGYYFVDVNNTLGSSQWVGLYKVLNHLKSSGKIEIDFKYSNNIKIISKLLSQCLPAILLSDLNKVNP